MIRSVLTVGSWTMASRILGFARDMLIASRLGAGPVADAFFVALKLPNLFRRLFGEGAFNAAFVPAFAGTLAAEGKASAQALAERMGALMGIWLGMLVLGAFWIGTLPAMLGLGLSLQLLGRRARARITVVAAATLLALGLLWLTGRAGLPGVSAPASGHEAAHCAPAVSSR